MRAVPVPPESRPLPSIGVDPLVQAESESPPSAAPSAGRTVRDFTRRLIITDVAIVAATTLTGLLLAHGPEASFDALMATIAGATIALWLVMLWALATRDVTVLGVGAEEYRRIFVTGLMVFALLATAGFLLNVDTSRTTLIATVPTATLALMLGRKVNRTRLGVRVKRGFILHRVLLLASPEHAHAVIAQLERQGSAGYRVLETVTVTGNPPEPEWVARLAATLGADTAVVALDTLADRTWTSRLRWAVESQGCALLLTPSMAELITPRSRVAPAEGLPLVRVLSPRLSRPARVAKRALDVVISLVLLLVCAVPMLLIALWIRHDSAGPAVFRQPRAGLDGRTFLCWKFRTMNDGSDVMRPQLREEAALDGAIFKLADDPRVTRVGRLLRRYSLDELPQLLMVLGGEMSLVGPRPHPLDDVERYDDTARRRLTVKPGMTGLWQVSGRSDLDWDEGVLLDLHYVENWSLALDLVLLARTASAVLRGTGSY
ncbi:MAG: exopolysaccharide biosynthesis polyprenyl glycosylphosphotransferase [Actinobacteria bacterium]|nr:exopolysaccharide biosynthesis polyprenyl glycosylphosphotransferase [Actinomycetota bacterium]